MQDLIIPAIVAVVLLATVYLLFFSKFARRDIDLLKPVNPGWVETAANTIGGMVGGLIIGAVTIAAFLFMLRWIVQFVLH